MQDPSHVLSFINMDKSYNEKFKNLVLYVLSHDAYREGGIKKLNKLLYFIDFYFYREHEKLISGARYAKADMGPVVDQYRTVFGELERDGALKSFDGISYQSYKPIETADLSTFTSEEIDHIGKVLDKYGRLSGSDLEGISHQQQPWVLQQMGEIIDPDLALLIADESEESHTVDEGLKKELVELADSV